MGSSIVRYQMQAMFHGKASASLISVRSVRCRLEVLC